VRVKQCLELLDREQDGLPEFGFGGVAVVLKHFVDFWKTGFRDGLFFIAGEVGARAHGNGPAGPGAPAALFLALTAHTAGQVLEMNAWVAHELFLIVIGNDPLQGLVGDAPFLKEFMADGHFSEQGTVDGQQRTGGESAQPEDLGITQ